MRQVQRSTIFSNGITIHDFVGIPQFIRRQTLILVGSKTLDCDLYSQSTLTCRVFQVEFMTVFFADVPKTLGKPTAHKIINELGRKLDQSYT